MNKKIFLAAVLAMLLFAGCATTPVKESFPTYNLNGTTYLPLISLCDSQAIKWEYDTFTRTVTLTKNIHSVNLHVGETTVLVDGIAQVLKYPVDIYQGAVVVPYKFKEQVLDVLFREQENVANLTFPYCSIRKVIIDAGHGGQDPGAIGRTGLREKDINLNIAKRLSRLFKKEGIEVVMTRSTDTFIPLPRRVDITNSSGADLFLSIHTNANRVRGMSGFEVYYVSPSISDSQRALNAAQTGSLNLQSASFSGSSLNLRAILWDIIYNSSRAEAVELARSICRTTNKNLDVEILGIKGARYFVLKGARIPAVLIEVGFVSNSTEERFLKNYYYREKIAECINEGVLNYARDTGIMQAKK